MSETIPADVPTKACPFCRQIIREAARKCIHCGRMVDGSAPPAQPFGSGAAERMLLPVGRSGWSIAAGYLGLFAVLPFFGLLAIIVSLIALAHLKNRPDLAGRGRAWFGLIMGVIFTGLYGLGFLLLAAGV